MSAVLLDRSAPFLVAVRARPPKYASRPMQIRMKMSQKRNVHRFDHAVCREKEKKLKGTVKSMQDGKIEVWRPFCVRMVHPVGS